MSALVLALVANAAVADLVANAAVADLDCRSGGWPIAKADGSFR